jgi:hypothetical protein
VEAVQNKKKQIGALKKVGESERNVENFVESVKSFLKAPLFHDLCNVESGI